jgi:regulatory protein
VPDREGGRCRCRAALPQLPFRLDALVPTADGAAVQVRAGGALLGRLDPEVARALGLGPGTQVDAALWPRLAEALARRAALEAGLRLLARRARARRELERRLRSAYGPDAAAHALARLEPYLDDAAFARGWVEERLRLRPLGAAALLAGLCRLGVDREVAARAVAEVLGPAGEEAERDRCLALARRRLGQMGGLPPAQAARRLWAYLRRRGFSAETVRATLRQTLGTAPEDGAWRTVVRCHRIDSGRDLPVHWPC